MTAGMRRAVGCLHWFGAMDLVFQHTVGTTDWENTCAAVLIGGLCHKDTTSSSQEQLSLALPKHSCLHCSAPLLSRAEVRLSALLGHYSSKGEDIYFLLRGIGWRTREEESREHQLKHLHIQTSASSQPDSALVLWVELPTAAPSVLVSLLIWLIPALLSISEAQRAVMGKLQPKGVLLNWTELQWRFQRWGMWHQSYFYHLLYF